MPLSTGINTLAELKANKDRLAVFGEDNFLEALQADLEYHNAAVEEQLQEFATPTTDLQDRYGTNDAGGMEDADEFAQPRTQLVRSGGQVAYPLKKYVRGISWTKDFLERATVEDLAKDTIAAQADHIKAVGRALGRALFDHRNWVFRDRHATQVDLNIKALLNSDGDAIPNGPQGESFDPATHHHYPAIDWAASTEAQRQAAVEAAITDLIEHGHGDDVRIYINQGNETQFRALPGFVKAEFPLVRPAGDRDASTFVLDTSRTTNRIIGSFNGFPVWTKPWVPFNYQAVHAAGDERKPLKFRQDTIAERRGLRLGGQIKVYPLQSDNFEAFYGFGAHTRTAAVALYMGGPAYTSPY